MCWPTTGSNSRCHLTSGFPGGHSFARICRSFCVEYRLTKPAHRWTNSQLKRLNRTSKEATVQRGYYQPTDELNKHLQTFLLAYNHASA